MTEEQKEILGTIINVATEAIDLEDLSEWHRAELREALGKLEQARDE